MLTRIYIDNFRSFVNFEYRPENKQLLLGPNGSGKSSLLDVILNVKRFLKGDEDLFYSIHSHALAGSAASGRGD